MLPVGVDARAAGQQIRSRMDVIRMDHAGVINDFVAADDRIGDFMRSRIGIFDINARAPLDDGARRRERGGCRPDVRPRLHQVVRNGRIADVGHFL